MSNLTERAVLVKLTIRQWTARKYDKRVSNEVAEKYGASQDSGRYNKVLVAQEAIKRITKVANQIRIWHYNNTLPWADEGTRILPSANFDHYSENMRKFKSDWETEVNDFINAYPTLKQEAERILNSLFNEGDYPSINDIAHRFSFETNIYPLPDANDFRVQLNKDYMDKIKNDLTERTKTIEKEAIKDLWDRLYAVVNHMVEKLSDKEARFHNTLVSNIQSLIELLPRLNITNDPNLDKMAKEIEDKLLVEPDVLRNDENVRMETANTASNILDSMNQYRG